MMAQRKPPVVLGLIFLIAIAGCIGTTTSYLSPPVQVSEDVVSDEQYVVSSSNQFQFNESVTINNQSYQVETSNWAVTYERSGPRNTSYLADSAMVGVISTPSAQIAGQEFNPLSSLPVEKLIPYVTGTTKTIDVQDKVGEINASNAVTTDEFTVSQYEAAIRSDQSNRAVDGYVLVATVSIDDAVIVMIGVYPEGAENASQLKDGIVRMMENVEVVAEAPEVENATRSGV